MKPFARMILVSSLTLGTADRRIAHVHFIQRRYVEL